MDSFTYRSEWSDVDLHEVPISVVTCQSCGCRLMADPADSSESRWLHFHPFGGRDALGHVVPCADAAHDRTGVALS